MFWEVSGNGSEVIGLLWNLSLFGILHRVILFRDIYFLHCTLLVTLVICLLFLAVVSVSNTQAKTPHDHTIIVVSNTGSTYVARWFS